MPLRFRSFAPYTLPGVLALIGWWWYISRKKARPAILQTEEEGAAPAMGLLSSPAEGSNGLLDKACCQATSTPTVHRRPSRDRPKAPEPRSAEQEVVVVAAAQVHSPLGRATEAEREAEERLSSSASPSLGLGRKEVPRVSTPHLRQGGEAPAQSSVAAPQKSAQARLATEKSSAQPERDDLGCSDTQQIQAGGAPSQAVEVTTVTQASAEVASEAPRLAAAAAPTLHADRAESSAELTKDERPEPEGEVAAEETPHIQLTPKTPQETLADTTPCPPSISTIPAAKEDSAPAATAPRSESSPAHPETPTAHLVSSPLFTSTPAGPDEAESEGRWQVENGIEGQLGGADVDDGDCTHTLQEQDYKRIAAGLITEVISAAAQQVQMTGSCEASALTTQAARTQAAPVLNGRPYSTDDSGQQMAADEADSSATRSQGLPTSDQSNREMSNGCLTAPAWERRAERTAENEQQDAASDSPRERAASQSKLQADDAQAAVEDSGCCQSEDGLSSEDLHGSGLPQAAAEANEGSVQASQSSSLGSSRADESRQTGSPAPVVLEEAVLARHEAATALQQPHLTVASLRNGAHASEAEGDQSGGGCSQRVHGCVAYSDEAESCSSLQNLLLLSLLKHSLHISNVCFCTQ